jgi:hypothetical protein
VKEFKPNSDAQEFFLSLPDSIFEACCGGEAGGGKSASLIAYPILRGWHKHAAFKGILFRKTYPQLEKSLIPRAQEFYEPLGAKWNGNEHVFDFKKIGGGKIWLSYLETMNDAREHDTNEYNYMGFDEVTHFSEKVYRYLLHRCRTSTEGLPHIVRSGATPGGEGNFWVYKRFVKPLKAGRRILVERTEGTELKRIYVPIKLEDNVDLIRENPDYVAQINQLPDAERRAKRGDWLAFIGQVFKEFRPIKLEGEPENAIHVVSPFDIPHWWPRLVAIDWGYSALTFALFGAVSPEGELIIYREFARRFAYITEWARDIKTLMGSENIRAVVIDPSAAKQHGHEKTIKQQVEEIFGHPIESADNDRLGGKMLLHELLRWQQHENMDEKNLPRIKIFSSCPQLVEAIQVCDYDENRSEDVKEFDGDDPYDTVRYLCKIYHRYINDSAYEFERVSARANILRRWEASGDYMAMARQMAKLETEERLASEPVKRIRDFRRHELLRRGRFTGGYN